MGRMGLCPDGASRARPAPAMLAQSKGRQLAGGGRRGKGAFMVLILRGIWSRQCLAGVWDASLQPRDSNPSKPDLNKPTSSGKTSSHVVLPAFDLLNLPYSRKTLPDEGMAPGRFPLIAGEGVSDQ